MNPRQFCRDQAYPKALLLTFSIDGFFEQVILQDLAKGRSSDVMVIADQTEVERTLSSGHGQFVHLGKRYVLTSVAHRGAFHPKMVLRLGPTEGRVMIGTGNLTSAGWGGNMELASAWSVGPQHDDNGAWLAALFDELKTWCATDMEYESLRRISEVPWLKGLEQVGPARAMHSTRTQALAPALAGRWAGRRFDEVQILTGSTDDRGAFLRWAHETFGVGRATVAVSPANASFTREALADLPIELRLVPMSGDRPLHAKFYWFEGPSGPAAVMGSANCSAAAWLVPSSGRGNMELVVPYDSPDPRHFTSILSIFEMPSVAAHDVLREVRAAKETPEQPCPRHVLSALRWRASTHSLAASISTHVPESASVRLHIGPQVFNLHAADGLWHCGPIELDFSASPIGYARIEYDGQVFTTPMRWVDHLDELQRIVETAKFLAPLLNLNRDANAREQQRLVDELSQLSRALLNDTSGFIDLELGRPTRDSKDRQPTQPKAVDADSLVRAIAGTDWAEVAPGTGSTARAPGLSLSSILGLLFEVESRSSASKEPDDDIVRRKAGEASGREPKPAGQKFKKQLAATIESFLVQLARAPFEQTCTATRLVQAVSFPLAVAVLGRSREWVEPQAAERWTITIVQLILSGRTASDPGLLGRIEERYRKEGRLEVFQRVIGDGTLWMVLLSTFAVVEWNGVETVLDKAVLLRRAFRSPQLIASATADRASQLLPLLRVADSRQIVAKVAPEVSRLLDEIEQVVTSDWNTKCKQQVDDQRHCAVGDWLYRPNVGWAVCIGPVTGRLEDSQVVVRLRGEEALVKTSFYLNVTMLAAVDPSLQARIASLRAAVGMCRSVKVQNPSLLPTSPAGMPTESTEAQKRLTSSSAQVGAGSNLQSHQGMPAPLAMK